MIHIPTVQPIAVRNASHQDSPLNAKPTVNQRLTGVPTRKIGRNETTVIGCGVSLDAGAVSDLYLLASR